MHSLSWPSLLLATLLLLTLDVAGFGAVSYALELPLEDSITLGAVLWVLSVILVVGLGAAGAGGVVFPAGAAALISVGLIIQYRIDPGLARSQLIWLSAGVAAALALAFLLRDHRTLERYKYLFGVAGILLLLAPIVAGVERGGAKLWLEIGPFSFQPAELAKILLAVFFAAYLTDRRRQLGQGAEAPLHLPRLADIGPLLAMWGVSLLILVMERDLGSSLLFFGLFVTLLYVATRRWLYPIVGAFLFTAGATLSYFLFSHLRVRIDVWIDPWADFFGKGYQVGQSLMALASGGIAGRGLGYGSPDLIPAAATDFPFAVLGEELGLLGAALVLLLYLIVVERGFAAGLGTRDDFGKLLATGLAVSFALQALVIIGGVTKAIPMTGVTLPLVSYGGSSLISNLLLLALLVRIGHPLRPLGSSLPAGPRGQSRTGPSPFRPEGA